MKVLIVKLGAITDVLFATPLVGAIRQMYDDPEIDWLVSSHAAPILRAFPGLHRSVIYDKLLSGGLYGMATSVGQLIKVWRSAYDMVFLLERGAGAQLLVSLTEAATRVRFPGQLAGVCLTHSIPRESGVHETEQYLNLLRALTETDVPNPGMTFGLTNEAQVTVQVLLDDEEADPPYLVIAPGGGQNPNTRSLIKRWMPERFAQLAKELADRGTVMIVGSEDEREACDEVAKAVGRRCINTAGRLDLPQLAAMCARAAVVVCNDSGPLYIAAALGTPTVSIFGPTDPRVRAPLGPQHRFLWAPGACGPCAKPELVGRIYSFTCQQPAGERLRCLRSVPVSSVVAAVDDALAGKPWPEQAAYWPGAAEAV